MVTCAMLLITSLSWVLIFMQMSGLRITKFSYFGKSSLSCMCSRYEILNVLHFLPNHFQLYQKKKQGHFLCVNMIPCDHVDYLASSLSKML